MTLPNIVMAVPIADSICECLDSVDLKSLTQTCTSLCNSVSFYLNKRISLVSRLSAVFNNHYRLLQLMVPGHLILVGPRCLDAMYGTSSTRGWQFRCGDCHYSVPRYTSTGATLECSCEKDNMNCRNVPSRDVGLVHPADYYHYDTPCYCNIVHRTLMIELGWTIHSESANIIADNLSDDLSDSEMDLNIHYTTPDGIDVTVLYVCNPDESAHMYARSFATATYTLISDSPTTSVLQFIRPQKGPLPILIEHPDDPFFDQASVCPRCVSYVDDIMSTIKQRVFHVV